jgi:hypothetical protein
VVRFEVLAAASSETVLLLVVAPGSRVEVYRRFRGTYCLHHQGDELHT